MRAYDTRICLNRRYGLLLSHTLTLERGCLGTKTASLLRSQSLLGLLTIYYTVTISMQLVNGGDGPGGGIEMI